MHYMTEVDAYRAHGVISFRWAAV